MSGYDGVCSGRVLHSLLASLSCPHTPNFKPSDLSWLSESPGRAPFLCWLASSLSPSQVLLDAELEAYASLSNGNLLSGALLSAALSSYSVGDRQAEACNQEELETQVRDLEAELEASQEQANTREQLAEIVATQMVREQAGASQVSHLIEAQQRDEKQRQIQIVALNETWNNTTDKLAKAVEHSSKILTGESSRSIFLSKSNLRRLKEAEDNLEKIVEQFIYKEFSTTRDETENDGSASESEEIKQKPELSTLTSEIRRLRVSYFCAEIQRIKSSAEEAGLEAALAKMKGSGNGFIKQTVFEQGDAMKNVETELNELVSGKTDRHCQQILAQDYREKVLRGREDLKRLEFIRDVLVERISRSEVLSLLLEMEKKTVEEVVSCFQNLLRDLKQEEKKAINFKTAMKSLNSSISTDETLITVKDPVLLRTRQLLSCWDLIPAHLATYLGVREVLTKLKEEKDKLETENSFLTRVRENSLSHSIISTDQILNTLNIKVEVLSRVELAPRVVLRRTSNFDASVKQLEKEAKKVMDDWESDKKKVNSNPKLRIQRDVWIDFLVRPQILAANLRSLLHNY